MKLLINTDKGTLVIETDSFDLLRDGLTYHISENLFGVRVMLSCPRGSPFLVSLPHSSNVMILSALDPTLLMKPTYTKPEEP